MNEKLKRNLEGFTGHVPKPFRKEKLTEKELRKIIDERTNWNSKTGKYDGFDMTGYGTAHFHNLELISRFSDLMVEDSMQDDRELVLFFANQGAYCVIRLDLEGKLVETLISRDMGGGDTTQELLFKIITWQNPKLLK